MEWEPGGEEEDDDDDGERGPREGTEEQKGKEETSVPPMDWEADGEEEEEEKGGKKKETKKKKMKMMMMMMRVKEDLVDGVEGGGRVAEGQTALGHADVALGEGGVQPDALAGVGQRVAVQPQHHPAGRPVAVVRSALRTQFCWCVVPEHSKRQQQTTLH